MASGKGEVRLNIVRTSTQFQFVFAKLGRQMDDRVKRGRNMHAGEETNMMPGAIWAFALPAILGLVAFLYFHIAPILPDLSIFSLFAIYFIFGSGLSTWLAIRHLKRIERLERLKRWRTSFIAGLTAASSIHLFSTILLIAFQLLTIYYLRNSDGGFGVNLSAIYDHAYVLYMLTIISSASVFFWFFITLPFTLLCSTIFWRVTKFPSDMDVFE